MSAEVHRYVAAKGYVEATKMIFTSQHRNSPEREGMTILPMHLLTGFALELFLKSWLLSSGRAEAEVRKLGHDVAILHLEAQKEGLPAIQSLDELVDIIAPGHKDLRFRYIEDNSTVVTVNWGPALAVLDELDVVVDAKIGASQSRGLMPGH